MSYTTIHQSTQDQDLQRRVLAAIAKEAYGNDTLGASQTGLTVKTSAPEHVLFRFMWPISIDNETAYEFALGNNVDHPGADPGVITDANIQAGVQAHWPSDT
jgi:hypothetical protein